MRYIYITVIDGAPAAYRTAAGAIRALERDGFGFVSELDEMRHEVARVEPLAREQAITQLETIGYVWTGVDNTDAYKVEVSGND